MSLITSYQMVCGRRSGGSEKINVIASWIFSEAVNSQLLKFCVEYESWSQHVSLCMKANLKWGTHKIHKIEQTVLQNKPS